MIDYLPGTFNSFPDAQVDDNPGEDQAKGKIPLYCAHVVYSVRDGKHLASADRREEHMNAPSILY